jgi:hypothetical protein
MLENTEGAIKKDNPENWQHRVHKTQDKSMLENTEGVMKKDNPEPVSCVSYVASLSGLFFFITPSVFSNMYLSFVLCTLCCQFLWIVLLHCPFGIL